jgi:cytochrome c-type biogenesis protein CcmH/NrfF
MDVIASSFLAGSILSWALPVGLVVVFVVWWIALARRSRS